MKLTKKVQYGILLVNDILTKGRTSIAETAKSMSLPTPFLEQISRQLRVAGILKATKGPGGGYDVVGEPTLLDVTVALDPKYLGSKVSLNDKVLTIFNDRVTTAINSALNVKFTDLKNEHTKVTFNTISTAVN